MIILIGLVWGWNSLNTWGYRKSLPSHAKNIEEWYWEAGLLPDYSYLLRATISESDFMKYIEKLGLTKHTHDRKGTSEN